MIEAPAAAAWLLTYLLHSTLLLGSIWWAVKIGLVRSPALRDSLWKAAIAGGLVTATVQIVASVPGTAIPMQLEPPDRQVARTPGSTGGSATRGGTGAPDGSPGGIRSSRPSDVAPGIAGGLPPVVSGRAPDRLDRVAYEPSIPADAGPLLEHLRSGPRETPPAASPVAGAPFHSSVGRPWAGDPGRGALRGALAVWIVVSGWALARLLRARIRLQRLLGRDRAEVRGEPARILERLCRGAGMRRRIRLTRSPGLHGPVALGTSEICLPERAIRELETEQLESLLAHELAHLVRRDPLWMMICAVVERLFIFQPLNRLGRCRMQENAEYLCDDWAVRQTGRRVTLARCLARVAGWIDRHPRPALVASMAGSDSRFVRRVRRLLERRGSRRETPRLVRAALVAGLLVAVVTLVPGFRSSAAACPPDDEDERRASLTTAQDDRSPVPHVSLGITVDPVGEDLAAHLDLEADALLVAHVIEGRSADRAGLRRHDILTAVEGRSPVTLERLRSALARKRPGDQLRLAGLRRGRPFEVVVSFGGSRDAGRRNEARPERRRRASRDADRDRALAEIEDVVREALSELEGSLGPAIEGVLEGVDPALENLDGSLGPALEGLDELLQGLHPVIEDLEPELRRFPDVQLRDLGPQIRDLVGRFEGLDREALEAMDEKEIEELEAEIEEVVEELVEPRVEAIEEFVEGVIEPRIEHVTEIVEQVLEGRLEGLEEQIEAIVEPLERRIELEVEVERLEGEIEAIVEPLEEEIEAHGRELDEEEIEELERRLRPRVEEIEKRMERLVGPRVREIERRVQELMGSRMEHAERILEELGPRAERYGIEIERAIGPALKSLERRLQEELGPGLERLRRRIESAVEDDHDHEHDDDRDRDHRRKRVRASRSIRV